METKTWTVRNRDALAAATVWVPFIVFVVSCVRWVPALPAVMKLRNDIDQANAAVLPTWLIAVGVAVVLVGVGVGALSLVPERPGEGRSRRLPLFWCGAVAGFVCAIWLFQMAPGTGTPGDASPNNALAGFAAIGAALYGFVPMLVASRSARTSR